MISYVLNKVKKKFDIEIYFSIIGTEYNISLLCIFDFSSLCNDEIFINENNKNKAFYKDMQSIIVSSKIFD